MKSQMEDISKLEKKVTIEVPSGDVDKEFSKAFKYLQANVEIKGFRKGKAPIDKIRVLYSDKVKGDVTQSLVQDTYIKALQEHKLNPIAMPDIQIQGELTENQPFSYTAQFEIQPEIELKKTEGLEVQKEKIELSEEKIDESLEQIRQNHSKLEEVKLIREAQMGDSADIDFEGFKDDQPMENGAAKGHVLELGTNSFIPGFEEGIVGMKPGEKKSLFLTFPEDYQAEDLKGQKVRFEVNLNALKKKVTPEWNDEFLKTLGDYKTKDDLKKAVSKDMEKNEEQRIKTDLKSRLFKALVAENEFDAPKSLVASQREALVKDFQQRMQSQGMTDADFQEYQAKWNEDFTDTAIYMVRSALLIQKIAQDENLHATKDDVEKKYQEMADQVGVAIENVRQYYEQQQGGSQMEFQITEEKVFEFLLSKANVSEVAKEDLPKEDMGELSQA